MEQISNSPERDAHRVAQGGKTNAQLADDMRALAGEQRLAAETLPNDLSLPQPAKENVLHYSMAPPPTNGWALDKAFTELYFSDTNGRPTERGLEQRATEIEQGGGLEFGASGAPLNVEDTLVAMGKNHIAQGWVTNELGLDDMSTLTDEQKYERIESALDFIDWNKASGEQLVSAWLFANDEDWAKLDGRAIETIASKQGVLELDQLRNAFNGRQWSELQGLVKDGIAEYESTGAEWVGGLISHELVPVFNVTSKQLLMNAIVDSLEEMTGEDIKAGHFFIGETAEGYRKAFAELSHDNKKQAVRDLFSTIQEARKKEGIGQVINDYMLEEMITRMLPEELLTGGGGHDGLDRFFGNFETVVEAIFSGWSLFKLGRKGTRAALKGNKTSASKAAQVAGNRAAHVELRMLEMTEAERLRIDQSTAATQLPKSRLHGDEEISLPGYDVVVERGPAPGQAGIDEAATLEGNIVPRIMEATEGRLARTLNPAEKSNVVKETLDKVQRTTREGVRAAPVPSMSVVTEVPDGINVQAVLAKNGTEAWHGIDELAIDMLDMDPNLEHFSILRRGADGTVEQMNVSPEEWGRILLNNFDEMSDADLLLAAQRADPQSIEWHLIEREAAARQGHVRMPNDILDDEYFLQQVQFRPWHPTDKSFFSHSAFTNTGIPLFRGALTPNAKFGDEIVGQFQENYLKGARTKALFEGLYKPFYKLSSKSKQAVAHMLEWEEARIVGGDGPADVFDFYAQFPDITDKEIKGLVALKRGYEVQYEVFNRRMYLDMLGSGYRTARPVDGQLPRFHGDILDVENVKVDTIYNPATQMQEKMTRKEIDDFYARGGRIMKLDIAVQAGANAKARHVLLDADHYKVGDLSTTPLEHVPNYTYRFYEDPYYIVKVNDGELVDGVKAGRSVEATSTVGSELKAKAALNRMGRRIVDTDGRPIWISKEGNKYRFTRARDVEQTDATLLQKQTLNKEGRLFWDKRQITQLNDIDGGRAPIMDMTLALERGTQLAARLNTEEDAIRALKEGLKNDYGTSANLKTVDMARMDTNQIVAHFKKELANATSVAHKQRLKEGLEVAKYIRQMEGIDSAAVRKFRSLALNMATWVERITTGRLAGKRTQNWAMTTDPLRSMRSTAFKLFMVFRPFRQALLQASQPMFLAGIDPVYVLSGKGLTDSLALRMAASRKAKSGFDPGYSNKALAKTMGLSKKEFTRVVDEFEKSGAIAVVDAHAFAGGAPAFNKIKPHSGGAVSRARHGVQTAGHTTMSALKQVGFDFGESINKTASFNVAWRRVMKQRGHKSVLDLSPEDWKQVAMDTENLSLSMSRPNNAMYQTGMFSVGTQFLSFSHKVAQAMIGKNPAISGKEAAKIWVGMFGLFGANMFGARDAAREYLQELGAYEWAEEEVDSPHFPAGTTVLDIISGGVIQTMVTKLGTWADEDFEAIDTENFTPVLNLTQFNELFLESVLEMDPKVLLGPFGNRATAFLRAADDAIRMNEGFPEHFTAAEKFWTLANVIGSGTLPQWGNITQGLAQYHLGKLYLQSGEALDIEASLIPTLAKIGFGGRTMAEIQYYRTRGQIMDSDKVVLELSRDIRRTLKQYWTWHEQGKVSYETYRDVLYMASTLAELGPEGRKMEILNKAMIDVEEAGEFSLMQSWLKGLEKGALTEGQIKAAIANMDSMPDEQKANIIGWVDMLLDARRVNDAEQLEMIKKGSTK
jgi:hypothetical protein